MNMLRLAALTLDHHDDLRGPMPTTGGMRPGPVDAIPAPGFARRVGARPVAIRIPAIQVDTDVETARIVDGVMQDPSGPWIVAWYSQTSRVGVPGNAVFAGHLDYYGVGPAVFWRLRELLPGDVIEITGNTGLLYRYRVEWVRAFDTGTAPVAEIVGPTTTESVTLITCGGTFDAARGEYDQRVVVRAVRIR
ncbi:MAG: hypothetical protein C4346_18430 [Chloroflexota bacterium]